MNGKPIKRLQLTVTVADPEQFTPKCKLVIYAGAFVELYNWRNCRQVHEIHGMIELKKMRASTVENPCNLGPYWIIEILSILHSAHMISRDQDKFLFYVNNCIDWDLFNQSYNPEWMEKGIRNTDAVVCKLAPL